MFLAQKVILEILSLSFTIAATLIMRWLLMLSTPSQDYYWLQHQGVYRWYKGLSWYRGTEYLHQVRANKIIEASIVDIRPDEYTTH
jgi:hypothetical protein